MHHNTFLKSSMLPKLVYYTGLTIEGDWYFCYKKDDNVKYDQISPEDVAAMCRPCAESGFVLLACEGSNTASWTAPTARFVCVAAHNGNAIGGGYGSLGSPLTRYLCGLESVPVTALVQALPLPNLRIRRFDILWSRHDAERVARLNRGTISPLNPVSICDALAEVIYIEFPPYFLYLYGAFLLAERLLREVTARLERKVSQTQELQKHDAKDSLENEVLTLEDAPLEVFADIGRRCCSLLALGVSILQNQRESIREAILAWILVIESESYENVWETAWELCAEFHFAIPYEVWARAWNNRRNAFIQRCATFVGSDAEKLAADKTEAAEFLDGEHAVALCKRVSARKECVDASFIVTLLLRFPDDREIQLHGLCALQTAKSIVEAERCVMTALAFPDKELRKKACECVAKYPWSFPSCEGTLLLLVKCLSEGLVEAMKPMEKILFRTDVRKGIRVNWKRMLDALQVVPHNTARPDVLTTGLDKGHISLYSTSLTNARFLTARYRFHWCHS